MWPIRITKKVETGNGWEFVVEVGPHEQQIGYLIEVDEEYWMELTDGRYEPEELVHRSLRFLLKKERIIRDRRRFNLREIVRYHKDERGYIREMQRRTFREFFRGRTRK